MAQLRDLALATTVVNQFKGISKKLINMEKFWLHSVATGLTARVIAIYRRESNADRFYLMGMLHDLGRLLLLLNLPGSIQTIMEEYEQGGTMYEVESNVLGFDHAAAAGQLMKAWQLPEMLQEAVEYHHKPEQAPHYPLAASIVHVADFIAHGMELGSCGERYVPPLSPKAWEQLEFQPNLLPSLMEQVDRQVKEAVEIFL